MTTGPSSLRPAPRDPRQPLVDANGRPIELTTKIGSGGEGTVYRISDSSDRVAKLYHHHPLPPHSVDKLKVMLTRASVELTRISAWPQGLILDATSREPAGFLMPMIHSARGMHDLYGTTSRRKHFPEVEWQHLVLAARNTAAAFDTLHSHGIVVGDVNQGNLLVDQEMCVRFIDCDSFQIQSAESVFRCPVGTPHFTPPELQGIKLDTVVRTPTHDEFGLAVLIFHLLFVGRHPFAGRIQGSFDVTIESAIAQRLFAYSKQLSSDQVLPPPCSLTLHDLPGSLAKLFDAAFRCEANNGDRRPPARSWVEELDKLLRSRKRCDLDGSHVHWAPLSACPWCRIETQGGPSHFLAFNRADTVWDDRVSEIEQGIGRLPWTIGPYVDPASLQIPRLPKRIPVQKDVSLGRVDYVSWAAIASVVLCGLGFLVPAMLLPAGIAAMVSGGYLLFQPESRTRRSVISRLRRERRLLESRLRTSGSQLAADTKALFDQFRSLFEPLFQAVRTFQVHGDELLEQARQFARNSRESNRSEYLQRFPIREQCGLVRGLTRDKALMLQRYGIHTAGDVDPHLLQGIPNINPSLQIELVNWRNQMYENYHARPQAQQTALDPSDQRAAMIRDFKSAKGQDVLFEAKRAKQAAQKIHERFARAHGAFEQLRLKWQKTTAEFVTIQQRRHYIERWVNNAFVPALIALIGLACIILAITQA